VAESDKNRLAGQVAVVTGAARGIGRAIAVRLAAMGADVVLVARDADALQDLSNEIEAIGGKAEAAPCDLQSSDAVAALGEQVIQAHGRCDILINNAGIGGHGGPLHEMAVADWDTLMATNLRAPYLTIKAFAPAMIAARRGHIVNISSLAGRNPLPNGAAYSASKWGLNGLTYSVAEELRQYGIRVSAVAPGSVNTHFGGGADKKDPATRIQPSDIADVVALIVTQAPQSFISEVLMRPTQK
jgi:3-oxoacyl-[acyl-carrier protein] reductase